MDKNTRQVELGLELSYITADFTERMKRICTRYALNKKEAASQGALVNFHVEDRKSDISLNMPLRVKVIPSDFISALKAEDFDIKISLK